nr:T9SS type A sorting domain-containing protein [Kaistella sp.]
LGVNDSAVKNGITIYPNPVGDILNIVSGNKVDGAEIYSADGKMLMKQKSENAVNVSALKPGVYLLKTTSNGNSQSVKFIKK